MKEIRLILLDVDGVLTDGSIILGADQEIKVFNVQDGLGIGLARRADMKVFFVTNRESAAVRQRAEELGIDGLFMGLKNKTIALDRIVGVENADPDEVAFVGDDLIDLPVMQLVGCPVAVANAVPEVKEAACYVTQRAGGQGAVREAIEWILRQNGKWPKVLQDYLQERGAGANSNEV